MADPLTSTNKGTSKFGLRPEMVEAKERIYTTEKELNGPNAEGQEAAHDIEERQEEEREEARKPSADEVRSAEVLNDPGNLNNQ